MGKMYWPRSVIVFAAFYILVAAIAVFGDTIVSGSVYCDQCKDGEISLFDYPITGIKVSMACPGEDGQLTTSREEITNWLGTYVQKFDGTPDLRGCQAQVLGSDQGPTTCGLPAGSAQGLRLVYSMFDTEIYTVDPLLTQPPQPMSYCPRSASPVAPLPPQPPKQRVPQLPPLLPQPPTEKGPQLPPLPPLPPLAPMPPVTFFEASACPHQMWMMPEHRCYWKILSPDMKVAVVFGPLAAGRYGTDITLWQSMEGRGDPCKTLLREATTALLNSYNSLQFRYHPLEVVTHFNWALMGSTKQILVAALRFMRANSGHTGNLTCKFTPCK